MVEGVWKAFSELRPSLARRGEHFMLFDGRPEHFIVQDGRTVGLIDLHDAKPSDGGMDLGVFGVLDEGLMLNVRAGYACSAEEKKVLEALFPFYVFLRRLAAAEWHGRFGPGKVADLALRLSIENPWVPSVGSS